ncbi:MAG: hypothetical protein ACYC19_06460 [Acidimicrobiales bacterium]
MRVSALQRGATAVARRSAESRNRSYVDVAFSAGAAAHVAETTAYRSTVDA